VIKLTYGRLGIKGLLILLLLAVYLLGGSVSTYAESQSDVYGSGVNFFDVNACEGEASTSQVVVTIDQNAGEAAAQNAEGNGTKVGYAIYDSSGKLLDSYDDTFENYGASITKSMILVAYLNQVDSGQIGQAQYTSDQNDLTAMIEQSDDAASNRIFSHLSGAQAAIQAVATTAGMSGFKYDASDPLYALGQSQITANDFAKFFSQIDQLLPTTPALKTFGLNLLSSITQQVGLLQANLPGTVYSKEGWKPEPGATNPFGKEGAPYIVNQAAQFSDSSTKYGIAVTVAGTADQASGEAIIKNVVSALVKPQVASTGGTASTVDATGTNVKTAYDFFLANGFNSMQSAAIVGNLMEESTPSIDPTIQNGIGAYGIAQWLGGRLTAMQAWVAAKGGNPATLGGQTGQPAGQLNFIIQELNTDYTTVRDAMKGATTVDAAVHEWNTYYEASGAPDQPRLDYANQVLKQYGSDTVTDTSSANSNSSGDCSTPGQSVNCTTEGTSVTGDAKILCEAEQFAGAYYLWGGGPHGQGGYTAFAANCPANRVVQLSQGTKGVGPCSADCSGLVSAAVDMAFNQNLGWVVSTAGIMEGTDANDWVKVPIANAQPGDIVTLDDATGHVEVVDHVQDGTVYTFGTRQTGTPASASQGPVSGWTFAFHWNGPGAN
jgi:hypothetical protein